VVVDAIQHISQVGLRIETIHFRGLNDGHGTGERFAAGI
jgi:hypothetical protein